MRSPEIAPFDSCISYVERTPVSEVEPTKTHVCPQISPLSGDASIRPRTEWPRIRGYSILSVIGSGGMGIVYKALHRDLQRTVAIKTLRGSMLSDFEFRERFYAEAEIVAQLQHPNIVQVFEIGNVEDAPSDSYSCPFISLEYVEGESLAKRTTEPQAPQFAAKMVEKLARAVDAAHRHGVIHRDLKPANVLLTKDGEPKIADFGVAKRIVGDRDGSGRFVTQAGMAIGTPEYMAPEQVAGETPTPAIDVYALGMILYELLTAKLPFNGATPAETMALVCNREPLAPRQLQPLLPKDLETICLKCLAKSPQQRYATAADLADDLVRWLEGRTIRARPVSALRRAGRWAARNPVVATLTAAVIVVALSGLAGISWKWREAESNANAANAAAQLAEKQTQSERWERYRANLSAASSALQLHNVSSARRALEGAPAEHRNWEWNYYSNRLDTSKKVIKGSEQSFAVRFSEGGRRAITVHSFELSRVWDVPGEREIQTIRNVPQLEHAESSRNGERAFYYRADGCVIVHDLAENRIRFALGVPGLKLHNARVSPDGSRVACSASDGTLRIWNADTRAELPSIPNVRGDVFGFSPEGRRVAVVDPATSDIAIWNLENGRKIALLRGHEQPIRYLRFNNGGDRLLSYESYPYNAIRLWDIPNAREIAVHTGLQSHTNTIQDLDFSPDDTRFVTAAAEQDLYLWDGRTGARIATLRGHKGTVNSALFSPDGKRIVTASNDRTVQIWDGITGENLAILHGHTNEVLRASYIGDGSSIVSGARDGTLRYWDARIVEQGTLRGHTEFVYSAAFHPDGKLVASAAWDGTVRIWQASTGREIRTLQYPDRRPPLHPDGAKLEKFIVSSVAFHPDGKHLASLSRENTIRLWDIETGTTVHTWKIEASFWQDSRLAFTKDGRFLAAGSANGEVCLWNVDTREPVPFDGKFGGYIRDVAFSPDGKWLAAGGESAANDVRVWDRTTNRPVQGLKGHAASVYCLAFDPTGRFLASGSVDGAVKIWDAADWSLVVNLKHGCKVYGLAFTPDGTRLAVGCSDGAIRFWDTKTHQEVAELYGHSSYVHSIDFSPDGNLLVSASGDKTLRIWDATPSEHRTR